MFFDIGANVGKWSLANINQCEKIISVEASPSTFERLKNECKHDRITLLNYAVCNNQCQDIIFYEANADTLSTINKDWLTDKGSRFYGMSYHEIKCQTTTIDKLIEQYGLPDLIKIDVEGGEYECITSLTQKVKLLCFEWASETNEITMRCIDYLVSLGFSQFYVQFEDQYMFRPPANVFTDCNIVKNKLSTTIPKQHWGMLWCK
mgnify:CR=1 FL=1